MLDRFKATLLCSAIGDSFGMPVEGWKREQIKKYAPNGRVTELIDPILIKDATGNLIESDEFGKLKYYGKDLKAGEYTDDTILTLAIAESIAEKQRLDLDDVARKHLYEYEIRKRPDGTIIGGFGKTTMNALENLSNGKNPRESAVVGGPGNGPAMKMAPVGLYMAKTGRYGNGFDFAYDVSKITHKDPRSIVSGVLQAHAVYSMFENVSREDFIYQLENVCWKNEEPLNKSIPLADKGNLLSRIRWVCDNKDADVETALEKIGNSSMVYKSFPFALFMVQKYWDRPLEGLIETVNTGGDCDTTGAIYGALAGARNGMFVPDKWTLMLKDRQRIENAAERIYAIR